MPKDDDSNNNNNTLYCINEINETCFAQFP